MSGVASEQVWATKPLVEVATLQRGHDLPVQDRTAGPHPIFAANGPVGFHECAKCEGPGVVTGRSGTIGKVHFVEGPYWPLNTSLYVTDFHGNDPKWVYYMLKSFGLERFAQGAGVPTLNRNLVHDEPIRVPPVTEQRRIAAILDQADALRAKRREALAQLGSLTQSIFIEMFGDPVTNERNWPTETVSNLCRLVRGSSPRPQGDPRYFGGPVPRLMIADITRDGWLVTPRIDSLTLEGAAKSRPVPAGTVVMAVSGNIGLVSRLAVDACVHDGFVAFTNLNEATCDAGYFLALLHMSKAAHEKSKAGAIFINLTTDDIKAMPIPTPPLTLQQTFATRIQAVESLRASHRAALAESDALFASLQHRAFAGQLS